MPAPTSNYTGSRSVLRDCDRHNEQYCIAGAGVLRSALMHVDRGPNDRQMSPRTEPQRTMRRAGGLATATYGQAVEQVRVGDALLVGGEPLAPCLAESTLLEAC